jgi:hypothetical protein
MRFFLRDFIPDSDFTLGHSVTYPKITTKEYTVQERVPQVTVASLPDEQKLDPRLLYNIHLLIQKLRAISRIVKQVNNSIEEGKLDIKLDLGGLSKIAEEQIDENVDLNSINKDFMNSPNLLVNPETMQLYCIDFGSGKWSEEKEAPWLW